MLDLFTIFSKGGIVLWCFQGTQQSFTSSVNSLIKSVILQERGGSNSFTHEALTLKYKLDNEFELVFVVAYQKILQLSYVDKFLSDIQLEFRNKYKDDLQQGKISRNFEFDSEFKRILTEVETAHKKEAKAPKTMKNFEQSLKSKKTIASMIENKKEEPTKGKKKNKGDMQPAAEVSKPSPSPSSATPQVVVNGDGGQLDDATIRKNLEKLYNKGKKPKADKKSPQSPEEPKKRVKEARSWMNGGSSKDLKELDHSGPDGKDDTGTSVFNEQEMQLMRNKMVGELPDMDLESSDEEVEPEEQPAAAANAKVKVTPSASRFGFLSGLRNMVGSKTLSREDIQPVLDKMKDHLIGKNVAAEIADKLCESVATKLEGKILGTFRTLTSTVKATLEESCVQILSPRRRVDILRDALEAKRQGHPYTITFCGVNGVGKSTNLAKIAFWLVENGLRVLIAACDTFRAGAVEQLRTHERKLNALHPPDAPGATKLVQLYEQGYGKDAAGIAMQAINYARDSKMDVVLVDTAGRMQDNEPLMRALSKLIKVNQPDMVLFVGEALVGNEAVDQLVKFNQALADHSNMEKPRLIDGILLTKFDTIDDKVGAAISMTYITGQPIVFVGTGQTYTDLKNLNVKAVVNSLLRG